MNTSAMPWRTFWTEMVHKGSPRGSWKRGALLGREYRSFQEKMQAKSNYIVSFSALRDCGKLLQLDLGLRPFMASSRATGDAVGLAIPDPGTCPPLPPGSDDSK